MVLYYYISKHIIIQDRVNDIFLFVKRKVLIKNKGNIYKSTHITCYTSHPSLCTFFL
jgi:hypothetical protein